jgi:formamidopyrimidine-DNA glycosylase
MPELPEVETTRRGIMSHITDQQISAVDIRQHQLRWPVPSQITALLPGQTVSSVRRRGKYLLLQTCKGTVLLHLGMSGSLRIVEQGTPVGRHDHVDLCFTNGSILRFTDPRRFGSVLWTEADPLLHPLLIRLGPEPLSDTFDANYLYIRARGRKTPVKHLIMDSHVVPGVGNIYANEALFQAGIDPRRQAGRIAIARYTRLVDSIRTVLQRAIDQGGTTLRDFTGSDGRPGYFSQSLTVYGRAGQACTLCNAVLHEVRMGGRSTVLCRRCQR